MLLFKPNVTKMHEKRDLPGLIKALASRDWEVGQAAAKALGDIGDARAVGPLVAALKENRDKHVREAAIIALGKIGDMQAVKPLFESFTSMYEGRVYITEALKRIYDVCGIEPFIQVLKDTNKTVRKYAAEFLGNIGDARAVEPLAFALKNISWSEVQETAADALGKIGDARAIEPLIHAFEDTHDHVRMAAAEAVSKIGEPAVGPLIQALASRERESITPAFKVRNAAARALGEIGDPRAVDSLIQALKGTGVIDCGWVIWALAKIGGARAVEPLIEALYEGLEHSYVGTCVAAARALGKIGDARAVNPLIDALGKRFWADETLRIAAIEALESIGIPTDPLTQARYAVARREWARAVSLGAAAVEPLVLALKDEDSDIRAHAAESLGKIGDKRAIEPLTGTIKDPSLHVRSAVAQALEKIGQSTD